MTSVEPKVFVASCGGGHLPQTSRAYAERGALVGFWSPHKNRQAVPPELFRRCWPFHLTMKPFYHLASQVWSERLFYACLPVWEAWLGLQKLPGFNVVHSVPGFASELFDRAEPLGALKVLDCTNSHPTTYYGFWQRECDLWCPGELVPVPRRFFARMNRDLERADIILCPSHFVRDSMLLNGIPAAKCFVNPFGVDTSVFQPRTEVPLKPRFVAVGTICVRKGHQYLFRAFEKVKRQLPDAELICVGDYKVDFRKERPKWVGTFTHHRSLQHPDLARLLQTCTAFVFPSTEEGFARVILEAMAAGLPIVASHESGATTLVEEGSEGFIMPPRDTDRLAQAMIQLAHDANLNQRMGAASHRKGAIRNTWQDYGDRLLAEYQKRLEARAGGRG